MEDQKPLDQQESPDQKLQEVAPHAGFQPAACAQPAPSQPTWDFDQLSQGQPEVFILFRGQYYRLRRTRNGRLILYK
jgi:hemin uptake protein HemP